MLEIHQLSEFEIGVTFKYSEEVKESLKETFSYEDRTWDPDKKMWKFPEELLGAVQEWAMSHFNESEIRLPGQARLCLVACQVCGVHGQIVGLELWRMLPNFDAGCDQDPLCQFFTIEPQAESVRKSKQQANQDHRMRSSAF